MGITVAAAGPATVSQLSVIVLGLGVANGVVVTVKVAVTERDVTPVPANVIDTVSPL
jgi:hypothetical protein